MKTQMSIDGGVFKDDKATRILPPMSNGEFDLMVFYRNINRQPSRALPVVNRSPYRRKAHNPKFRFAILSDMEKDFLELFSSEAEKGYFSIEICRCSELPYTYLHGLATALQSPLTLTDGTSIVEITLNKKGKHQMRTIQTLDKL